MVSDAILEMEKCETFLNLDLTVGQGHCMVHWEIDADRLQFNSTNSSMTNAATLLRRKVHGGCCKLPQPIDHLSTEHKAANMAAF